MALSLLNIDQMGQISACHLALLLDVVSPQNKLETFLARAKKILRVDHAICIFQHEPYAWSHSALGFKSFKITATHVVKLLTKEMLTLGHQQYTQYQQAIMPHIPQNQRLVAFPLLSKKQHSIGQLIFLDDCKDCFAVEDIAFVQELLNDLVEYLELKANFATLQESYEQVSTLNHSKTKFFQIIAHDLRAPFHGLIGFSEVLAEELETLDPASIQNIASYLNDTASSTYHLLENLLNWAMAEGGRFTYQPINFELKQASHIVMSVLGSLALNKKIQLIDRIPDDLKVYADLNMVTSTLQNLVSNALKFTPTDGTGCVTISAERKADGIYFYVTDTGLGMNNIQIKNIFDPKLKSSLKGTAGEKGTGLGLVLCKRFVELNKGHILVNSKEGHGTTFTVQLPCAELDHTALVLEKTA